MRRPEQRWRDTGANRMTILEYSASDPYRHSEFEALVLVGFIYPVSLQRYHL